MKVGVKYCGGCNPRYDRKQFLERLIKDLKNDYQFESVKQNIVYDALLVLGGCGNCCANYTDIKTKYGVICVRDKADYEKTIQKIKEI